MLKIRRSCDRLSFNMGIRIPVKDDLYIETGSWCLENIGNRFRMVKPGLPFWVYTRCNYWSPKLGELELSCCDTCQIWMRFRGFRSYFYRITIIHFTNPTRHSAWLWRELNIEQMGPWKLCRTSSQDWQSRSATNEHDWPAPVNHANLQAVSAIHLSWIWCLFGQNIILEAAPHFCFLPTCVACNDVYSLLWCTIKYLSLNCLLYYRSSK